MLRPRKNMLADIICVSPKLEPYRGSWRHHQELEVVVDLNEYLKFILSEPDMYKLFSQTSKYTIQKYLETYDKSLLKFIYADYARDIALAQAWEIIRADKEGLYATTISYVSPLNDAKVISYKSLPVTIRQHGIKLLCKDLINRGYVVAIELTQLNNNLLLNVLATYAYYKMIKDKSLNVTWNIKKIRGE